MKRLSRQLKSRGFTLLEVMIAIGVLGVSMLVFFQAQARVMRMAEEAGKITNATMLARLQLNECKEDLRKVSFSTDYSKNGDFSELGFPDYSYECYSYPFKMPTPNVESISSGLQAKAGKNDTGLGTSAAMLAPFFGLIAKALQDSVRELVVIIKYPIGKENDELRVTTHVTDNKAMIMLVASLPEPGGMLGGLGGGGAKPATPAATPPAQTPPGGGK